MSNNNNQPPPWSEAPPWAMWMAQDESGKWTAFRDKPFTDDTGIWTNKIRKDADGKLWEYISTIGQPVKNPNWRDTLQKRPENE